MLSLGSSSLQDTIPSINQESFLETLREIQDLQEKKPGSLNDRGEQRPLLRGLECEWETNLLYVKLPE